MTEYRRYQGKSYMILKDHVKTGGFEYRILSKQTIRGLLPVQVSEDNGQKRFWYEISGKQSLDDWFGIKKPGGSFLRQFMESLTETIRRAGDYLLYDSGISLSPEEIFIDPVKEELAFCYKPFDKKPFMESLRGFMEYYLSHMAHQNRAEAQKCYDVYEKCQCRHTLPEELLQILFEREDTGPAVQEVICEPIPEKKTVWKDRIFRDERWKHMFSFGQKKKAAAEPVVFEPEDCQKEEANPTVFLGSETPCVIGELRYEGMGEEKNIKITKSLFLVGSLEDQADGIISADTVSRIHARITKEGEDYYLEDMNSTNGTSRNGTPLHYKEKVKLEKNDKILFAKERYRFV